MKLKHLVGIPTQYLTELSTAQVKELQQALDTLGYDTGAIDGIAGNNTHYAWRRFKEDNHQMAFKQIGNGSVSILQNKLNPITSSSTAINWTNGGQSISKYFTVREVTKGDPRRVPNDPNVIKNILALAKELDKIREDWGSPITVTSWYRPLAVNRAIGSGDRSQHIQGLAADICPANGDLTGFQSWLDKRWDKALGYGAKKGFVHIDLRPGRIRWNY